jgi:predicted CXXCH cytochrome family protein
MKLRIGLGVIVLSAFGASLAYGAGSVVNSVHNMNSVSNDDVQMRVCAFCHTPHHALSDNDADYNPLWSHTFTSEVYSEYQSPTLQSADDGIDVLAGSSRLCMSCHDGAIAVDQHYSFTGADVRTGDGWNEIAVGAGGDLSNDHPIGFDYAEVGGTVDMSGGSMTDVTVIGSGDGKDPEIRGTATPLWGNPDRTVGDLMLDNGTGEMIMTCGSCHDVHDTFSVDDYFLVGKQANSEICLTCHIK